MLWANGTSAVYKCGRDRRFQLCYVNVHRQAGAPVMTPIVFPDPDPQQAGGQAGQGPPRKYVMPGFHAVSSFGSPDNLYTVAQVRAAAACVHVCVHACVRACGVCVCVLVCVCSSACMCICL